MNNFKRRTKTTLEKFFDDQVTAQLSTLIETRNEEREQENQSTILTYGALLS